MDWLHEFIRSACENGNRSAPICRSWGSSRASKSPPCQTALAQEGQTRTSAFCPSSRPCHSKIASAGTIQRLFSNDSFQKAVCVTSSERALNNSFFGTRNAHRMSSICRSPSSLRRTTGGPNREQCPPRARSRSLQDRRRPQRRLRCAAYRTVGDSVHTWMHSIRRPTLMGSPLPMRFFVNRPEAEEYMVRYRYPRTLRLSNAKRAHPALCALPPQRRSARRVSAREPCPPQSYSWDSEDLKRRALSVSV